MPDPNEKVVVGRARISISQIITSCAQGREREIEWKKERERDSQRDSVTDQEREGEDIKREMERERGRGDGVGGGMETFGYGLLQLWEEQTPEDC